MFTPDSVSAGNSAAYNAYLTRAQGRQRYEFLPGLEGASATGMRLLHTLYDALSGELPPSSSADGFLLDYPGVDAKWGRLLNVIGVAHNPMGVPPFSAAGARRVLAARGDQVPEARLSAASRRRYTTVASFLIGDGGPVPVHIRKGVSLGVPSMSKDPLDAWRLIRTWFEHGREIRRGYYSNDQSVLAERYEIANLSYVAYRYQGDDIEIVNGKAKPKERLVEDWQGKWLIADRTLPDDLRALPDSGRSACCRGRKLNAGSFSGTWPLRIVSARNQAFAEREFDFLKNHNTPNKIADKLRDWPAVRIYDLKNHDMFIPDEAADILARRQGELFGPFWGDLYTWALRAPQIVKNDYRGGKGFRLDGDPFNRASWQGSYVNPSGFAGTSMFALFACVAAWYDAGCSAGLCEDSPAGCKTFLDGGARLAIMAAGDNVVACARTQEDLDAAEAAFIYGILTRARTFLGNVIMRDRGGYVAIPDITSYILNFYTPMRPINAPLRGHWATGWLARQTVFGMHPLYKKVREIEDVATQKEIAVKMQEYAERNKPAELSNARIVSVVDAEFNLNPDIVHYKRGVEELSQGMREANFLTVLPMHYAAMFRDIAGRP